MLAAVNYGRLHGTSGCQCSSLLVHAYALGYLYAVKGFDPQHPCLDFSRHSVSETPILWPLRMQARQKEVLQLAIGRATSAPVDEVKLRKSAELDDAASKVCHPNVPASTSCVVCGGWLGNRCFTMLARQIPELCNMTD